MIKAGGRTMLDPGAENKTINLMDKRLHGETEYVSFIKIQSKSKI